MSDLMQRNYHLEEFSKW